MIAVIADDLSGAAEVAGLAARYGLRSEVHTAFDARSDADVVSVDTDTRSAPAGRAAAAVADVALDVLARKPSWIFKKTDSVLRGNVRAEIEALLDATGQTNAIVVPANPSKGRIIRNGLYSIGGTPLSQTVFARDADHPRRSSRVADLIGAPAAAERLEVPDVTTGQDVADHAGRVGDRTLPAGGADFFAALLDARCGARAGRDTAAPRRAPDMPDEHVSELYVCGSAAAWDAGRADECAARGLHVVPMPQPIFLGNAALSAIAAWHADVAASLATRRRVMIAIGRHSAIKSPLPPTALVGRLVDAVVAVLAARRIDSMAVEGGATAAALVRRFGWTRFEVLPTALTGTTVLRPPSGPSIYVKPGSYPWNFGPPPDVLRVEIAPRC